MIDALRIDPQNWDDVANENCDRHEAMTMSPYRRDTIRKMLAHYTGASVAELTAITNATSSDVRQAIRALIDGGADIKVQTYSADRGQVFYIFE